MDEEEHKEDDGDEAAVQISIETSNGRTNLTGTSVDTVITRRDDLVERADDEVDEPTPAHAGGEDPDLAAIDEYAIEVRKEGERYPGWRVGFSRKLAAYVELIRPFTLLAPIFGGLGGSLLALFAMDFQGFDWGTLVYGIATLVLLNAASNCMNGSYDAHIDRINKPYRPIPKGLLTRDEASSLAFALYGIAFIRAIFISIEFWALVMLITGITIYYSMPPIRLKKRLWVSNISIAAARGLIGFVAAWTIFGDPLDPTPWVIGGIMFIYLVGATTSKDFTDLEGDRKYGMRTLPVVYGPKRAAIITGPFFVVPFLLIPAGVLRGYLIEASNYILVLVVWGLYVMILLQNHATERDPNFENSPAWKHMYLILFALQLGFAVVYLFDYLA
jgi:4-hydroxybenzoate polyprenyltransferase